MFRYKSFLAVLCLAMLVALPAMAVPVYNPDTGHWYQVVVGDWIAAEDAAVSTGGHLVTINDAAENQWLADIFGPSRFWIGANDADMEGTWVWSSGAESDYSNWYGGEPNDYGTTGEDYGVTSNGMWNDVNFEDPSNVGYNVKFGIAEYDTVKMPESYLIYNDATGHWYDIVVGDWIVAEETAVSSGGHLVTIEDAAENQWLVDTFGPSRLWTGANDADMEGTWVWSSGAAFAYSNWYGGEPNDYGTTGEDYGVTTNGVWNDVNFQDPGNVGYSVKLGIAEYKSVPEPSTLLLFGTGLVGIGVFRRRFKG